MLSTAAAHHVQRGELCAGQQQFFWQRFFPKARKGFGMRPIILKMCINGSPLIYHEQHHTLFRLILPNTIPAKLAILGVR